MNFLSYRPFTEIEFLSRQTMVFATGNTGVTGTIATITPADGLTFVLLGAQVVVTGMSFANANFTSYRVELRNETNVRDVLGGAASFPNAVSPSNFTFQDRSMVRGDILEGDGIKTYTLELVQENLITRIDGTIYGYTRNT